MALAARTPRRRCLGENVLSSAGGENVADIVITDMVIAVYSLERAFRGAAAL
jgi:hypothetical protein